MKLALAFSVLAGSVGLTTSFVVNGYHPAAASGHTAITKSSTRLQYMDNKAGEDHVMDLQGLVTDMNVVVADTHDDKLLVENLAFSLNMNETVLQEKYQVWLNKYNKIADTSRYFNWKRNFLMQEVWNRTNGESFDLNEFGDYTKQEFDAMNMAPTETTVAAAAVHGDAQLPVEEVPHAYYLNDNTRLQDKPKPKFKQVQTFSGGFRMIPAKEADIQVRTEIKPVRPASLVDNKQQTSTTVQGQRFRKVRLFSGGFMIVPNNGNN